MPDLPGWHSLEAVTRYHRWAEIIGIVVLALLVIAELISYRYGQRKENLTTQQQEAAEERHNEEVARLHRETAALMADAGKSRAAITAAEAEAAKANERTAELNLALEEERTARLKLLSEVSSRHLNPNSAEQLIKDLKGKVTHVAVVKIYDEEALNFVIELINAFKAAGIETTDIFVPPPPLGYMVGLCVVYDEQTQRAQSRSIASALSKLNVGSVSEAIASPTMADGTEVIPDVPRPALYVGLKTPPFPQTSPGLWDAMQKLKPGRQ